MFRAIPVSNKICFDKELKRNWKIHEQKLMEMKSKLSKQRAEEFSFLQQSKKRNTIKDIENRQIDRSNNILFRKIQAIQRKGNKSSYLQPEKDKSITQAVRTLHEPFRKRQLFRIVEQNQDMLKRIRDKRSAYNVRKMQQERKDIQKNISLISEFKYKNYPITQTKVNLYMSDEKSALGGSRTTNNRQSSSINVSSTSPRCKTTLKSRSHRHSYFSQTQKTMNNRQYLITTYVHKGVFYIEVQNLENHLQKYRMQMNEPQLEKLLQKFYERKLANLVESLEIDKQHSSCFLKFKKNEFRENDSLGF